MLNLPPIRPTLPPDTPAIDALLDQCFGPARLNRTASLLRHGADPLPGAAFVAEADGAIIGSVAVHRLWWEGAHGDRLPLAWLGPLVSHPDWRNTGLGQALMQQCLAAIDAQGLPVALIGDAPYYGRWGFDAAATGGWQLPGPVDRARLLLRTADPKPFHGPARLLAQPSAQQAA